MLNWVFGKKERKKGRRKPKKASSGKPSYEESKVIAAKGSVDQRKQLAANEELEPEFLYYFATDESPEVRIEVAENTSTPLQADAILAKDDDEDVRAELAEKIGRLVPILTEEENEKLTEMAIQILEVLAQDQVPRVRAIIAQEIKSAHNVPIEVVRRLAEDVEEIVAAPVIEYSPLLTDRDLMELISRGLASTTLCALAERKNLSHEVSGAVAGAGDAGAVTSLLKNDTAEIADITFEKILEDFDHTDVWHSAMVKRDNLPLNMVMRLARFVSATLIDTLLERNEIPDEMVAEIRQNVRARIDKGDVTDGEPEEEPAEERAKKLHKDKKLTEELLKQAIESGDFALVRHGLALLSGLPLKGVSKLLNTGGAKAVICLAIKAKLSLDFAVILQLKLGRVKEDKVIYPPEDGSLPVSQDDIEWYMENALI